MNMNSNLFQNLTTPFRLKNSKRHILTVVYYRHEQCNKLIVYYKKAAFPTEMALEGCTQLNKSPGDSQWLVKCFRKKV